MKTRAITGLFFIIVMLGSVLTGHYPFGVFYLLLSLFCLHEFYGLLTRSGIQPNKFPGFINAVVIYTLFAFITYHNGPVLHKLLLLLTLTLSAVFVQELFKISVSPFTNIAYTFLGVIFITIPFTFFHALAYVQGNFNAHFPLAFLLMLWANDTGAYLAGRSMGRTKLFERHSPKKTWEGFIGGVIISAGTGFVISLFFTELAWNKWISAAILISVFGTLGDLIESMFKRSINIKDSGSILPGHGGLLDRFDGFLLAAPVVFTYLYFVINT